MNYLLLYFCLEQLVLDIPLIVDMQYAFKVEWNQKIAIDLGMKKQQQDCTVVKGTNVIDSSIGMH